jgi:hypothetical protein
MGCMHETGGLREGRTGTGGVKDVSKALHDLCQPLTTLQCRLELASVVGTVEAYREAVELGLEECSRLMHAVWSMREIVRAAEQEPERTEASHDDAAAGCVHRGA